MNTRTRAGFLASVLVAAVLARSALAGIRTWTTGGPAQPPVKILSLAVDPSAPGTLYAGSDVISAQAFHPSLFRSADSGTTWLEVFEVNQIGGITAIAVDASQPRNVYAGTGLCHFRLGCAGTVYKSEDSGDSWVRLNSPGYVTALAVDPNSPGTLQASVVRSFPVGFTTSPATFHGLRSADGAQNWTEIVASFPSTTVSQFLFDPARPGVVYVASSSGVFKSVDGGLTWAPALKGLTSLDVRALAIAGDSASTLYAGTGAGLFKSSDGAASWSSANFSAVVLAIVSTPRVLFAATSGLGVFESRDEANTWTALDDGLTNLSLNSLVLDPSSVLHAGGDGGVFDFSFRGSPRVVSSR